MLCDVYFCVNTRIREVSIKGLKDFRFKKDFEFLFFLNKKRIIFKGFLRKVFSQRFIYLFYYYYILFEETFFKKKDF